LLTVASTQDFASDSVPKGIGHVGEPCAWELFVQWNSRRGL